MLAITAMLQGGTAISQPRNPYGGGTRLPEHPELEPADAGFHQTRMVLERFSECLAKRRPADVQKYLLADGSVAETVRLRLKVLEYAPACLNAGKAQFLPLSLQGGLADAMLRQQKLLDQPLEVAAIPPLDYPPVIFSAGGAANYLYPFGECVVRADASDARALVGSEPDTPEEANSFNHLMPAFAGCVDKNRTFTGGKTELRAAVAYNYYELAAAAHPASLSSGGKN